MSDHLYHYSVSLLRGGSADWIIEPVDASIRAVYQECLNQNPGNSYLAIKTVAGLTYCVFLSGDSCHADVCGWIISLNGWGILDIDTHLCLSQVVWEQFANTSVLDTRASLNDFLLRLVELHGLISKSSPFLINRDIDTPCIVKKVTPQRQGVCNASEDVATSSSSTKVTSPDNKSLFTYFIEYYTTKLYFNASGRACRREFWGYTLFNLLFIAILIFVLPLILGILGIVVTESQEELIWKLVGAVTWPPGIVVTVRRLHDTGRSGAYFWFVLIPFIGALLLIYLCCLDGQPEANKYGPSLKYKV